MDSGQTLAALKRKSIVICLNTIRKMSVITALETKIKDMERTKLMLLEKQAKHTPSKTDFETQARTAKNTEPFQLIQRLRGGMLVHNIEAYARPKWFSRLEDSRGSQIRSASKIFQLD